MIGLAVFTAILNSDMRSRFEQIPGYGTEFQVPTSAAGYRDLAALPEGETKTAVLSAFSDALRVSLLFHVSWRELIGSYVGLSMLLSSLFVSLYVISCFAVQS
jgi:hypothetical protein